MIAEHPEAPAERTRREGWKLGREGSRLASYVSRFTFFASCFSVGDLRPYRQWLADGALLLVTLIWGSTFVMVKDAVTAYPVFAFLALRFGLATLAFLPLVWLRRREIWVTGKAGAWAGIAPTLHSGFAHFFLPPVLVGAALFAGFSFQTFGLQLTTPAKAGFITGLSVVIVPLVTALVLRQSPGRNAWLGVGLATIGLALLTLRAGLRIAPGDLLVFGCALAFAGHILLTGRFAPHVDPLLLTLGQVMLVALLGGVAALMLESPPLPTGGVLFAAAFTGVLATSAAFGIQTVAQRFTTATHTALIFAAEPVFAALFSFWLIGEVLGPRQLLGSGLILVGMVVAEVKRKG